MLSFCEAQASLYFISKIIAEDNVRILTSAEETDTAIRSISNLRSYSFPSAQTMTKIHFSALIRSLHGAK